MRRLRDASFARWPRPLLLVLSLSLLPVVALNAQEPNRSSDSTAILRQAQLALTSFEARWRSDIESQIMRPTAPVYAICEVQVGTGYCYGPTNGRISFSATVATPNADRFAPDLVPRQVRRRADAMFRELIQTLRMARDSLPGDRWITGQLVRLHLEHGDPAAAADEAAHCNADAWWCDALKAHTLHLIGVSGLADSLWTRALRRMPVLERCAWLDPSDVVRSDSLRRALALMNCTRRTDFAERLWWLSDPLYLTPGNERRSEHLSRQLALVLDAYATQRIDSNYAAMFGAGMVHNQLESALLSQEATMAMLRVDPAAARISGLFSMAPLGYSQMVRRLGVPGYLHPTRPDSGMPPKLVGLYPTTRYTFVPRVRALANHRHAQPSDWNLFDRAQYEFYAAPTPRFVEIEHQIASFRRGDSARVVVASDLARIDPFAQGDATGALISRRDYPDSAWVVRYRVGSFFFATVDIPRGRTLMSLEILSRGDSVAGRVRFGVGPPDMPAQRVTMSDVLLLEHRNSLPSDLEDAGRVALGSEKVRHGSTIGVFWEMYGLTGADAPTISIRAVRRPPGLLARIGRAVGLAPGPDAVSVELPAESVSGRAVETRAVDVDLSALSPGEYVLSVAVEVAGQQLVESVRNLEIVSG